MWRMEPKRQCFEASTGEQLASFLQVILDARSSLSSLLLHRQFKWLVVPCCDPWPRTLKQSLEHPSRNISLDRGLNGQYLKPPWLELYEQGS
ncbi:hypothetical protein O1611_g9065 [Lasiodiplodia mahajangana]|uniref:Uncharacterized protein n=1 Tax=Lasiodiplodia mahajangana TaxID=1108764 RepID=A0ACC2JAZ7_9PEZI|nr:hypothetical protein O1611_g9065 [Lasiodiplodia mahajangana]